MYVYSCLIINSTNDMILHAIQTENKKNKNPVFPKKLRGFYTI